MEANIIVLNVIKHHPQPDSAYVLELKHPFLSRLIFNHFFGEGDLMSSGNPKSHEEYYITKSYQNIINSYSLYDDGGDVDYIWFMTIVLHSFHFPLMFQKVS